MISVDLIGIQVDPISGAAALVLREHDAPNRLLPIVVGQADASSIAIAASGTQLPRPMTHDLLASVVDALTTAEQGSPLTLKWTISRFMPALRAGRSRTL